MYVHVFEYGDGCHYWAAILDLNVKMVSEHSKIILSDVIKQISRKLEILILRYSQIKDIISFVSYCFAILQLPISLKPNV